MITIAQIRRLALALPDVYEQASHGGMPSWRTKPRGFAWVRVDPEALALWVDSLKTKERLLAAEPELFFTTPHYDGYAMVLVRMDRVSVARAKELLTEAWRVRTAKPAAKKKAAPAKKKAAPARKVTAKKSTAKKSTAKKPAARKGAAR